MRSLIYRCIALFALIFPTESWAVPFDNIYVLGDSLSDQGNLLAATALIPGAPLLPDPLNYFNGRFSNGPNYVDVLAQQLGLSSGPSLLGGNNFAFGGARTTYNFADSFFSPGLFPWSLNAETAAFAARHVSDPNALYIVFSGSNDIGDIVGLGLNPAGVMTTLLSGIDGAITAFRLAGAQTILIPNVPDLGLEPAFAGNPAAAAAATALSRQYDAMLSAQLAAITGVNIIGFDTFDWSRAVVNNPAAFGFSNVTSPCYTGFILPDPTATECSNPDDYLFWDIEHPTSAGQARFAAQLLPELVPVPEPSPLSLFVVGALVCCGLRAYPRKQRPM